MPDRNRHPLATLLQAQYACFGLATALISMLDIGSLARHVVLAAGWTGSVMLWGLAVCSGLSLADVVLNHHRVRRVWWLGAHRHWFGIGQAFSWTAMVFVGLRRFDAFGLMVVYMIAVVFLGAFLLYEARSRRAACARDPAAC